MAKEPIPGTVRLIERARTVAGWLEQTGHRHEAEIIRELCRSNSRMRASMSQLHSDNMALRAQLQQVAA